MAESVNQQIADRLVRRQIQAGRVETTLRRQVLERLAVLEQDILAALKVADPTDFALLARRRREVERLMDEEIDPEIHVRYEQIARLLDAAMLRLAQHEAKEVERIVNDVAEDTVQEQPSDRQLRAGVVHGIFSSASKPTDLATSAADWWQRAADSFSQRIGDTLITGVALEESLVALTRRIRGTAENGFVDGIMGRARDDAQRVLTTQMTNTL